MEHGLTLMPRDPISPADPESTKTSASTVDRTPHARRDALRIIQSELASCRACDRMVGPVVHGPPVASRVLFVGQAPGPHEGALGRPFAWTAGKTLFRWLDTVVLDGDAREVGSSESIVRNAVYFAAVARCFPGKSPGGGDRRPDPSEIARCRTYLEREVGALEPKLVVPIGTLAIEQVLGRRAALVEVIGETFQVRYHGAEVDVVPLPHPSGASPWHKMEPGKALLARALAVLREHPTMRAAIASARREAEGSGASARSVTRSRSKK